MYFHEWFDKFTGDTDISLVISDFHLPIKFLGESELSLVKRQNPSGQSQFTQYYLDYSYIPVQ